EVIQHTASSTTCPFMPPPPPTPTLFPYTTLFRSHRADHHHRHSHELERRHHRRQRTAHHPEHRHHHRQRDLHRCPSGEQRRHDRSEEHTSELQSLRHLVCRLLLEKKNRTMQFS